MEKFMGREEKEKKEKGGYGERLREITAVLKKHAITRGVSPEKLRLILEDLGPTYIKLGQIMHQADIPGHGLIDSFSLNLDHNLFARLQRGTMYLGNRCRSQRFLLNMLKFLLPRTSHGLFQYLDHLGKRHRRYL